MKRLARWSLALLLATPGLAQQNTATVLAQEFASWKLAAATTSPTEQATTELRTLERRIRTAIGEEPNDRALKELLDAVSERVRDLPADDSRGRSTERRSKAQDIVIAEAVVDAVRTGDVALLDQLGARAIPALRGLAMKLDGTTIPDGQLNPLRSLATRDAGEGLSAALELMESGDVLKKGMAAAVLRQTHAMSSSATWLPIGENDWKFADERWARLAPAAFEEPALSTESAGFLVVQMVLHGVEPGVPEDRFEECLRDGVRTSITPDRMRPMLLRMLDHSSAKARESAAQCLLRTADVEPVFELASDPDDRVRNLALQALGVRQRFEYSNPARSATESIEVVPEITDAYRTAARTLAIQPDEGRRRDALRIAGQVATRREEPVFDAEFLMGAVRRAETQGERVDVLRHAQWLPAPERIAIARAVVDAVAADEAISADPTKHLEPLMEFRWYGLTTEDEFWELASYVEQVGLMLPNLERATSYVARREIANEKFSAERYIEWLERHADPALLRGSYRTDNRGHFHALEPWMARASSPARARAVRLIARHDSHSLGELGGGDVPIALDDLLILARDVEADRLARSFGSKESVIQHGAEVSPEHFDALIVGASHDHDALEKITSELAPHGRREAFLSKLFASPMVEDDVLSRLHVGALGADVANAAVHRFPPETWARYSASHAISELVKALVRRVTDRPDPRLESANVRDTRIQRALVEGIRRNRRPVLLPLLDRVAANTNPEGVIWSEAIDVVSGYFDDDAAAILLREARRSSHAESRQEALDALAQMTAWRDAAAAWETSQGAAAKRDRAIRELVEVIDDVRLPVTVRAEALRGLGLLNAAEELPRLVRALTSPTEEFAKAAREALDRMHASTGD